MGPTLHEMIEALVDDATTNVREVRWDLCVGQCWTALVDESTVTRTLVIPLCQPGTMNDFYLLQCQCRIKPARVHIMIKGGGGCWGGVSAAERQRLVQYIEQYVQPWLHHLYINSWKLAPPRFSISGLPTQNAAQTPLTVFDGDRAAEVMACAAEIAFSMKSF
jgi:hypothetical protein